MTAPADRTLAKRARRLDPPVPPAWVAEWAGDAIEGEVVLREGAVVRPSERGEFGFFRATVPEAKGLPEREFRLCVERTYLVLRELLRQRGRVPLRFWNYVPGIRARVAGGLSRYELFNLGRYLAYTAWYGSAGFGERLAAASAVDHRGDDLVVHVFAGRQSGEPIENPRQTPAYLYSRRYGPLPPCFSRASVVRATDGSAPWAIVAGTSSIVGEESRHAGDCAAQLEETLSNLAHLSAAFAAAPLCAGDHFDAAGRARALARFRHLRAYVVREADESRVLADLRRGFPGVDEIEVFAADLCRPELLVEVEGVLCTAEGDGPSAPARPRV